MPRFIALADGTLVSPLDVKSIGARLCKRPFVDADGVVWDAVCIVETRNRVIHVPHATLEDAESERDFLRAAGDREHDTAQRRYGGGGAGHVESRPVQTRTWAPSAEAEARLAAGGEV